MPKNNEYSIIFCNPYLISRMILSSTRNTKLKHLNMWNNNKRYLAQKEDEAIKDLETILKRVGINPSIGWLVRVYDEDKLELYSNDGQTLIMQFNYDQIIITDDKTEYVYSILQQRLIEKKEDNFVTFVYNYNSLVLHLFLNKENNLKIFFWGGYEEERLRKLIESLKEAPDIITVFKIIWENLECDSLEIIFNDDHLLVLNSKINYMQVNNQEYQVSLTKDGLMVANSLLKISYDDNLVFNKINNMSGENLGLEQIVEHVENGQKAISLVRKKMEEIIPRGKK